MAGALEKASAALHPPDGGPFRVGFLLVPDFALLPYAASVEPLRAANRLSGRPLFSWRHVSSDAGPVAASSGVGILAAGPSGMDDAFDLVLVCAGTGVEAFSDRPAMAWLRGLARRGVALGGVSGGPYLLARAGLLDGYRATLHWDHIPGIIEEFPDLDVTGRLYEIDRDRLTCSGGMAPLDMMHALIAGLYGAELAASVSEWVLHTHVRFGEGPQRLDPSRRFGVNHPGLIAVLAEMEARLEAPASRAELAERAGLSIRQVERLFRARLGRTIGEHYLELRLRRARVLLQQTGLSVLEIALACGFSAASPFSRAYRARFGHPPRAERQPRGEARRD